MDTVVGGIDVGSVLADLRSSQVAKQIAALDKIAQITGVLVQEAVHVLTTTTDPYFVAERLVRLGSAVVPPLEGLLTSSDVSPTVKTSAALALLHLGSKSGAPLLMDTLLTDSEYVSLAANYLAMAQVPEAADRIIARLRMYDPERGDVKQADVAASLLRALEKLGAGIPPDLRSRLTASNVPWQVRTAIDPLEEERLRQRLAQGESWEKVMMSREP